MRTLLPWESGVAALRGVAGGRLCGLSLSLASGADVLLLEDGSRILLEDGSSILLENASGGASIAFTLASNPQPRGSFGWTVGTFSGADSYVLDNDASGQFSIGGSRLRLEKAFGSTGTPYTITVTATKAGFADTQLTFTITVADNITNGLVARWNALDTSKLWQDSAGSTPVALSNDPIGKHADAINGYACTSSGSQRPSYVTNVQNGHPGIYYDGTDSQRLDCTVPALLALLGTSFHGSPWTIKAVIKPDTYAVANHDILGFATGSVELLTMQANTSGAVAARLGTNGSVSNNNGNASKTAGNATIMTISSDGGIDNIYVRFAQDGITAFAGNLTWPVPNTNLGTAFAATKFSRGARAFGSGTYEKGYELDVLLYNREIGAVEDRYIDHYLANLWGITLDGSDATLLDYSNYTLWFEDDFDDVSQICSSTALDTTLPDGWLPYHISGTSAPTAYGSPGALSTESSWFADIRNSAFNGLTIRDYADSCLQCHVVNTPGGLSANVGSKPYLTPGQCSYGYKMNTFGIIEGDIEMPAPGQGIYVSIWMMPGSFRWTGEIDINEMTGNVGTNVMMSTLHFIPYEDVAWAAINAGAMAGITSAQSNPIAQKTVVDAGHTDFHRFSTKWDETGISFYFDGQLVGTAAPWNGVRGVTIGAGGTSIPVADGNYTWYAYSGNTTANSAQIKVTVAGGVCTAIVGIINPGAGFSTQPVWYRTNTGGVLSNPVSAYGVSLTADIGPDPAIPMPAHEPFYVIVYANTDSFAGTFNHAVSEPVTKYDRVRWWRKNRADPARLTSGSDPTFDTTVTNAVSAITGAVSALTGPQGTALATFVRAMMAWQLRFDTTPPHSISSHWDVTKLSLWSAFDALYLPFIGSSQAEAYVNILNPGTNNLVANGSGITWTRAGGLVLPGTIGTYLDSGLVPPQFGTKDNAFSAFLPSAPTNAGAAATIVGTDQYGRMMGSSSAFDNRLASQFSPTSYSAKTRGLSGHLVMARGYMGNQYLYESGECHFGGYVGSNDQQAITETFKIGAHDPAVAGAAFPFLMAGVGRRLVQEEARKFSDLLTPLMAAFGITF